MQKRFKRLRLFLYTTGHWRGWAVCWGRKRVRGGFYGIGMLWTPCRSMRERGRAYWAPPSEVKT